MCLRRGAGLPQNAADDIEIEASRGEETLLARALGRVSRRLAVTALPQRPGAIELGTAHFGQALPHQGIGQAFGLQQLLEPALAAARGLAVEQGGDSALIAEQPGGGELVEHAGDVSRGRLRCRWRGPMGRAQLCRGLRLHPSGCGRSRSRLCLCPRPRLCL